MDGVAALQRDGEALLSRNDSFGKAGEAGHRVGGKLFAGEAGEFERWGAVAGEEAVGGLSWGIAGWTRVEK
ncbi:hypothetical protein ASF71_12360 [Deinococcus sp. Leaf326]|nr:hypothetical protein ASF71_12360 [Deinococcus sp. Leaf326]